MIWWLSAIALIGSSSFGCGRGTTTGGSIPTDRVAVSETTQHPGEQSALAGEPGPFRFVDVVPDSGVDFIHVSGMTPNKHFPTANGSGVAIFDYDGDGKLDLYFATGNLLPLSESPPASEPAFQEPGRRQVPGRDRALGPGIPRLLPRHHRR